MRECPWSCSGLFWFYPWRLRAVGSSQRASRCGFQFPRFPSIDGESESESHSVLSNSLGPHRLYSPWNSLVQNTGVGSLSLLQGIFPTQGLNPALPYCRQILYRLSHKGSPRILEWVAYPFSRESSWPRNQTRVFYLQVDSLPTELSGQPLIKEFQKAQLSPFDSGKQSSSPTFSSNGNPLHWAAAKTSLQPLPTWNQGAALPCSPAPSLPWSSFSAMFPFFPDGYSCSTCLPPPLRQIQGNIQDVDCVHAFALNPTLSHEPPNTLCPLSQGTAWTGGEGASCWHCDWVGKSSGWGYSLFLLESQVRHASRMLISHVGRVRLCATP